MCKRTCEPEEHVYAPVVHAGAIIVWQYQALDIFGRSRASLLCASAIVREGGADR
jgi:hypothetical protein